ncbi:MAG: hypothetical protein AB7E79_16400 [Rhodospirillaceae bacterium]
MGAMLTAARILRAATILLLPALSGCASSLSSFVSAGASDYHAVESKIADEILLQNILMARDGLPLHFSELLSIRGTLTLGGQLGMDIPLSSEGSTPTSAAPLVSVQTQPTFEVTSLEKQDFTRGILSPVDPAVVQHFLDLGVDYRVILLLFFSGLELEDGTPIANWPFDQRRRPGACSNVECSSFFGYLDHINELTRFRTKSYRLLTPVGKPFDMDEKTPFRDLAEIDTAKYVVRQFEKGPKFQLYQLSAPETAFCFDYKSKAKDGGQPPAEPAGAFLQHSAPAAGVDPVDVCKENSGYLIPTEAGVRKQITLRMRSVYGMIRYLGEILKFGETEGSAARPRCISLDSPNNEEGTPPQDRTKICDEGNVFFTARLRETGSGVSVRYRGQTYYAGAFERSPNGCYSNEPLIHRPTCDHTLEVLSVVGLLLNLNKTANELGGTPTVVVAPGG